MTSPSIPSRKPSIATPKARPTPARRPSPTPAQRLQQRFGNRGTQGLLQAMMRPGASVQRQSADEEQVDEELQMKAAPGAVQRQEIEEEEPLQGRFATEASTIHQKDDSGTGGANRTGMPDGLKSGLESLSGLDLSGVRVHRNSSKPAQLNALAYTQGQDIHVGPGQEKHLPHEGWHAVQQMQGRVQPTMQAKSVAINDDPGLEREADVMGTRASQTSSNKKGQWSTPSHPRAYQLRGLELYEPQYATKQQALRQPAQRTIGDGHDLRSNRFKGNIELEKAYDNETIIRSGANGIHVTIIQQALVDSRFPLPTHGVDGIFGPETKTALKAFQTSKGLTGRDVDGRVGPVTMDLLDQHFLGHTPEHAIATDSTRTLTEGTRSLTAAERAAFTSAITTEVRTPTGALPTFNRIIATNAEPYEVRIAKRLNQVITILHGNLVASRPARTAGNLMTGADVDRLAQRAKTVTDAVYSRYSTGPALAFGVNIFDQFTQRSNSISASSTHADWSANFRVLKILNGDSGIRQIDREHGAVQSRAVEWGLISGTTGFPNQPPTVLDYNASPPHVTTGIVGTRRSELLDIHRNWPASAGGGQIFLQRYLESSDVENRDLMYGVFATIIHEYIHTLEHPNHVTYRRGLPEQRGGFVLREGMTDYLAKIIWDNVNFDPALRSAIEDRFQDPLNPTGHPIPSPARYNQWTNAERAVGVVGIRNAMAAYFLGRTDLIGGP